MASNAAATDLGALLQQSIDSGLTASAHASGQMPVQLAPLPTSGVQALAPSYVPPPPASTARPIVVDAAPVATSPSPAKANKKSGVLGIVLGTVFLASAMGGGAVWYVHHHQAKVVAAMAAQSGLGEQPQAAPKDVAPPVAKDALPSPERVETPVIVTPPAEPIAAKTGAKAEEAPTPEPAKIETKSAKRTHRAAAPGKVAEAPKPVAKATQPVVEKEAPKAAPPPKPAGGAVDAVLQQQLSGAL